MASDELTASSTCSGPIAIVQSGGIQPVAVMPAKLADAAGAAVGARPGASAAAISPVAATSSLVLVSLARTASFAGIRAFGASALSASKASLEMGYRLLVGGRGSCS